MKWEDRAPTQNLQSIGEENTVRGEGEGGGYGRGRREQEAKGRTQDREEDMGGEGGQPRELVALAWG